MTKDEMKSMVDLLSQFANNMSKTNETFVRLHNAIDKIAPKMKQLLEDNSQETLKIIDDNFKKLYNDFDKYKELLMKLDIQYEENIKNLSEADIETLKHKYELETIKIQNNLTEDNNKRDNWFNLIIKVIGLIAFGIGMYIAGNPKAVTLIKGVMK